MKSRPTSPDPVVKLEPMAGLVAPVSRVSDREGHSPLGCGLDDIIAAKEHADGTRTDRRSPSCAGNATTFRARIDRPDTDVRISRPAASEYAGSRTPRCARAPSRGDRLGSGREVVGDGCDVDD
jgi:hypothetical protein